MDGDAIIGGDEKIGVVLADSAEVKEDEVQAVIPNTSDVKIMGQPQLNFDDFLLRDQWIADFDWSITDSVGTLLYARPLPNGMLVNTARRAFDAFRFRKMDALVTLKVQSTQFHSGRIAGLTVPMTSDAEAQRTFLGTLSAYPGLEFRRNQTFAEHVFVDAASSASATLRIPFRYFKSFLEGDEDFAQFYIVVFNQLRVGDGGDATASCTLYIRFEETEMRVINPLP